MGRGESSAPVTTSACTAKSSRRSAPTPAHEEQPKPLGSKDSHLHCKWRSRLCKPGEKLQVHRGPKVVRIGDEHVLVPMRVGRAVRGRSSRLSQASRCIKQFIYEPTSTPRVQQSHMFARKLRTPCSEGYRVFQTRQWQDRGLRGQVGTTRTRGPPAIWQETCLRR